MSDDDDLQPEFDADERAGSAVRILARRTPTTSGWRPADSVRRSVQLRKRRRVLGAGVVVVLAAAGTVALATGGSDAGNRPSTPPLAANPKVHVQARVDGATQLVADQVPLTGRDPSAARKVTAAEQSLAVQLLRRADSSRNASVSPISLYVALAMLRNGARGQTEQQIATALQSGDISTSTQNAGLADLMTSLTKTAAGDGITLQSANSVWAQRGFEIRTQFLAALASYYRAGVWQTDLTTPAGARAINTWTAQQTHGRITKLFEQLDPSTVLVLANAVYFHADWQVPFNSKDTLDQGFTTGDGKSVTAKFMTSNSPLKTYVGGGVQAAEFPYQGGRYAALAVMPTSGSLPRYLAKTSAGDLASVAAKVDHRSAVVELPRFTTKANSDLVPTLRSLGMTLPFTDSADFSGLSAKPTAVDQVRQRVYLGVGEKGTTAAAVTGAAMRVMSLQPAGPRLLTFDHPFMFLIRDTVTGAILFASTITDPTAG